MPQWHWLGANQYRLTKIAKLEGERRSYGEGLLRLLSKRRYPVIGSAHFL